MHNYKQRKSANATTATKENATTLLLQDYRYDPSTGQQLDSVEYRFTLTDLRSIEATKLSELEDIRELLADAIALGVEETP